MIWLLYIFIFIVSCVFLYLSGDWVVGGIMKIARFLGWREFVVAFFVMAVAASLPNLFIGIVSACQKVSSLSFGDVLGNNLVALTLAVALATLFAPKKEIPADSRTIQATSGFTLIAAILPLILILDGVLSRIDGVLLIGFFLFYLFWLFSKKERFTRVYDDTPRVPLESFGSFFKDLIKTIFGVILLLVAAQGIVKSARFFAESLDISLILFGVLVVGLGNALPEVYFAVTSARKGETFMILGNLMGSVIIPATLVLGVVSLIFPIRIANNFDITVVSRIFLVLSVLFFYWFTRSHLKITSKEAYFLLLVYIIFVTTIILFGID